MMVRTELASSCIALPTDDPDDDDDDDDPDDDDVATGLVTVWLLPPQPASAMHPAAAPLINAILAFMVVASERCADR
jgi:hypothetical protein